MRRRSGCQYCSPEGTFVNTKILILYSHVPTNPNPNVKVGHEKVHGSKATEGLHIDLCSKKRGQLLNLAVTVKKALETANYTSVQQKRQGLP